jgi:hypothetical protein
VGTHKLLSSSSTNEGPKMIEQRLPDIINFCFYIEAPYKGWFQHCRRQAES